MRRIAVPLVVLAACGGGSSKTTTPEPATPLVWKEMDLEQRTKYMMDVVLPKTKELFVALDAKYDTMDCITCHGDGAKDGSYEMPNPKIKPLPNTEEAFIAWVSKEPAAGKMAEFMATKLEPLMGELLQKSVYDPKTKTGELSCGTCHTLVDASGTIVTPEAH
jgi:hypothetical protein